MIKEFLKSFFFNEDYCFFCKENIIKNSYLCEDCLSKIRKYDKEIFNDYGEKYFKKDILFYYSGMLKTKIKEFKFENGVYLKKPFGKLIFDNLDKSLLEKMDYIAYVPSSKKKIRQRGYNHSKLLAEEISKYSNIQLFDNLHKIKNTKSQHFLSLEERSVNLKNSFLVDCDLTGKNILLIDDIHTSGATIDECYKELKKANCNFV
ncbi:ComF family protein [Parvimonas sp. D9]|uniref:ComF family protein n=1 Tax=Parvimonas sp. D9 TaxID=3110689 RepID=UPI002B491277|nr:ComF family protein [Parvimonas sp. D9]MEB3058305.1 ComF family protein [Parvimonas sp. D9]